MASTAVMSFPISGIDTFGPNDTPRLPPSVSAGRSASSPPSDWRKMPVVPSGRFTGRTTSLTRRSEIGSMLSSTSPVHSPNAARASGPELNGCTVAPPVQIFFCGW